MQLHRFGALKMMGRSDMEDAGPRMALARAMADWKELAPEDRLAAAPGIIARGIEVWSNALRQDLAKDRVDKAIRAYRRGDLSQIEHHLGIAVQDVAHIPVDRTWDELRAELAAARRDDESE